jgi:undecaprenyl-diphosphatase
MSPSTGLPEWLAVLVLGAIEGLTEFVPVSSTGHLLIAEHWLGHRSDLFNIVIQSAAVLAVLPLFRHRLAGLARPWRERESLDYGLKLAIAFGITGVGGLLLSHFGFELPESPMPVAFALLAGGIAFIVVERRLGDRRQAETVGWSVALAVGLAQLVAAALPGTSRSGAAILVALALGLARPAAIEFAFLVGIPTMLAAGGLKIFEAWSAPGAGAPPEGWAMVGLGCLAAAAVSFAAVWWIMRYVRSHTFVAFGWYRIVLAVAVLALLLV